MSQREGLANLFVVLAPLAVGLAFTILGLQALVAPHGFARLTLGLYAAGFVLFLAAKLSLVRRGIRISFGSARMSPWNRRAYRAGYALMIFACLATIVLLKFVDA